MTTADWYHCSVKPVSRSAGRSVVAAAAYRLGQCFHDERYDTTHDYTRRRGVETAFSVMASDAPEWARDPQALWNAAERAEKRVNSRVAREVELALPSLLSPEERQRITEQFATELVERYNVAVSVAIHSPGKGDERNYHAHIMFTTREMMPDGLGKKTRVLDDLKTGPQEVTKLRELAADIINEALRNANADIRVDHRSFKERGIDKQPTTHLGPAACEMERRGEGSERGDINREAAEVNQAVEQNQTLSAELDRLNKAIAQEQEQPANPPTTREEERERIRAGVEPFTEAIRTQGELPERDGLAWWQRAALHISMKARSFTQAIASKGRELWQDRFGKDRDRQDRDQRGSEQDRNSDDRGDGAMKEDFFNGGKLWGGAKEKREPARALGPQEQRRGGEKVVPLHIGDRVYQAFELKDNAKRLHIRTALQGSFYPSYHYLRDMRFGHDLESIFTLIYTFMTVEVTGERLAPIVHAIASEDCKCIHEFHPRLYDPPERGAPIIEKILILSEEDETSPLANPHQPH